MDHAPIRSKAGEKKLAKRPLQAALISEHQQILASFRDLSSKTGFDF
jgi:hypothetical protein